MEDNNVFNQNFEEYEQWFIKNNRLFDSEIQAIRQVLPPCGEGIEIGVGTGLFSLRLNIKYGIEPAEKPAEKAIERGVKVTRGFAEDLPIKDEAYQYALMITVDCFLNDIKKAFKEIRRIIAKDGMFIIAFIDKDTTLGKLYNQNKHSDKFYKDAEFHSSKEILKLLNITGFKVLDEKQTIYTLENKYQEIRDGVGEGLFAVIKAKRI